MSHIIKSDSLTEYRDLLKRHVAGHEADHGRKRHRYRTSDPGGPRVTKACIACSNDHLKCSEDKPCTRCVAKDLFCQWPGESDRRTAIQATSTENGSRDLHDLHFVERSNYSANIEIGSSPITPDSNVANASSLDTLVSAFPDEFRFQTSVWTPRGFSEFGFATSIDLNELDLSFLDSYNTDIPFDYREIPSSPLTNIQTAEAFRKHWHFRPNSKDHVAAEQQNFSISDHVLPETRRATEKLTATTRDKILAMVLKKCLPENISKAVASFPSLELLDVLLQYCLTSPVSQVDVFLHLPTFYPNNKRPELLGAVIAYGALLTGDPSLTKLGLAIQECVRTSAVSLVRSPRSC
jgi:hypothetical protein